MAAVAAETAKFRQERREYRQSTGIKSLYSGRRAHKKIRQHTLALNDAVEITGDLPQPDVLKYVGLGEGQALPKTERLMAPAAAILAAKGNIRAVKGLPLPIFTKGQGEFQPGL